MNRDPRYVFDTNTLVSALLFEHPNPGQAFSPALRRGQILLSLSTLEEPAEVLQRETLDRYVTASEREDFLVAFVNRAAIIEPTEIIRACRDPKDDKFLELAVSRRATCLVSGDTDLLILNPFRGIAILTSAAFLAATEEVPADEETNA